MNAHQVDAGKSLRVKQPHLVHQLRNEGVVLRQGRVLLHMLASLHKQEQVKIVNLEELGLELQQGVQALFHQVATLLVLRQPRITRVCPEKNHYVLLLHRAQTCDKSIVVSKGLQQVQNLMALIREVDACTRPHQVHDSL